MLLFEVPDHGLNRSPSPQFAFDLIRDTGFCSAM